MAKPSEEITCTNLWQMAAEIGEWLRLTVSLILLKRKRYILLKLLQKVVHSHMK